MDEYTRKNMVVLCGAVQSEPTFSHENHGERFYRFPLAVQRLSGQQDCLWVLMTASQLRSFSTLHCRRVKVEGQLRSFNNKSGQGSKLVISVLARSITETLEEDRNCIRLTGVLCKPPVLRRTPLGRCICDVMLAVNRRYGRADYLPCIAWGQVAVTVGRMGVGDTLSLDGRLQSRQYTKVLEDTSEVRTAFEVSIMQLLQQSACEGCGTGR